MNIACQGGYKCESCFVRRTKCEYSRTVYVGMSVGADSIVDFIYSVMLGVKMNLIAGLTFGMFVVLAVNKRERICPWVLLWV